MTVRPHHLTRNNLLKGSRLTVGLHEMTSSVAFLCLMNRRWVMWGGGEIKNCLSCQSKLKRNLIIIPNQHGEDTKSVPPYNGSTGLDQDNYAIISSSDKAWTDPETQHWVGPLAGCSQKPHLFVQIIGTFAPIHTLRKGEQRKNFRWLLRLFGKLTTVGPFQPECPTVWIMLIVKWRLERRWGGCLVSHHPFWSSQSGDRRCYSHDRPRPDSIARWLSGSGDEEPWSVSRRRKMSLDLSQKINK